MSSGATCSARRAKKDWGRARRSWVGGVAMGVALGMGGRKAKSAQTLRFLLTLLPRAIFVYHTHNQLTQISSSQKKDPKL